MSDVPTLRIVRGDPSAEELAVVTAVVTAAGGGSDEAPVSRLSGRWNDPAMLARRSLRHGPGAWRTALR